MGEEFPFQVFREQFFENLPYKVMWMDEPGNIIYANKNFLMRLGYSRNEVQSLTIFDINPSATEQSWRTHWEKVSQEKVHSFKAVHQTKKGKFYDVEVSSHFFSNNGKNIIAAIVNDITESSFYKNLLDHSERMVKVGGWKLNLQDGSLVVTQQALTIFNSKDNNDLLPGNIIHFFEESGQLKSLISKVIRNGESYDKVLTLKKDKGVRRYIRCVAEPVIHKTKIIKIIGAYQDVTLEREKNKELKTFKEIIDNTKDMIYFRDQDYKLKYYNKSTLEFTGWSEKEIKQNSLLELFPEFNREDGDNLWKDLKYLQQINFKYDHTIRGEQVYWDATSFKIKYQGENLICLIANDITEVKKKEIELKKALREISELKKDLEHENLSLKEEINDVINYDNIICQSDEYLKVLQKVNQVAPTDTTVLITGESGTGKELLARAVHDNSKRKDKPLIKVNATTLPKELIESELFGHKKGAFTGATEDKVGKFSLADGGTIFLDEIGELPLDLQPKLLRVIQEGEFDPLGSTKTIKVDVRIVTATNRHLGKMVKEGKFRDDLFYRLNVFPIHNIPLRERRDDIPLLAQYFLEKYSAKAGKRFKRLSKRTIGALLQYNFPGNIRELENLIERAVIIENGTTLQPGNWIPNGESFLHKEDFKSLEAMQRDYIIKVLDKTNWRVSGPKGAAAILDMKDKTLFARMKRLGIEKQVGLKKD